MKRILTIVIILFCGFIGNELIAQEYKGAIGLRGGYNYGITGKYFFTDKIAGEGILSFRWRGVTFTGLAEYQSSIQSVEGLDWFAGGGFYLGYWDFGSNVFLIDRSFFAAGLALIGGVEYTFQDLPINILGYSKESSNPKVRHLVMFNSSYIDFLFR